MSFANGGHKMDAQLKHPGEDVKSLQRCINDLVSMLSLPALWSGGEPSQVGRTLIDVLQRMLHLELIYVQLKGPLGDLIVELARTSHSCTPTTQPVEVGAQLYQLLGDDPQKWPSRIHGQFGAKNLSIMPLRLGLQGEIGVLVTGAERSDFPGQTEELLLRVAANQVVLMLHEYRLRHEQKQLADELDQQVAQRTKELAASNQQLQLQVELLQLIPVAACTIRPDGRPDFVNQKWLEYTGQTLEYVLSRPEAWMSAVHPEDRENVSTVFWDGIRSGGDFAMETRFRRARDGAYRWHLNRAVALHDAQGTLIKFVGTSTDIEDLKASQETLRNTQTELASMTRVLTMGQLTASIAHEVNQPLSGIITNASTCLRMLDANPPNVEGARETARRTIRDGNRASEIITRLRALFTKRPVTTEFVDLNEAAREVIALMHSRLKKKNVILRLELADLLPLVTGDRVQLQEVIMNLLQNASDAMIDLNDRPRQLLIRTQCDDTDHVCLTVQDSGIGLDPQAAGRLFDAFFTTKTGGMGIGLTVCRSIIESHGGRIWAKPNDGPGATLSFSIPRNPEKMRGNPETTHGENPLNSTGTPSVNPPVKLVRDLP